MQPRAVAWRSVEARAPWRLQFPASKIVIFGQVIVGSCTIERDDGLRLTLEAGDFLLMAAPPAWTMGSADETRAIEFQRAFEDPSLLQNARHGGAPTTFIAGRFSLALAHADLLTRLMLPVVHVRAGEVARGRLGVLLGLLGEEVLGDRPGRSLVSNRLLELLLIEALRQPAVAHVDAGPGLLAGLADPCLGPALRAMHDDVRRSWTVAELARRVALSRSAFAARFHRVVGTSPIDYLIRWRMTLARDSLIHGKLGLARIADMIGYQSVSAFSIAFDRVNGCPPGAYRKRHALAAEA